jgi:hypothetical protein
MMEIAPGNLTEQQKRMRRLAGYDEFDLGQPYLVLLDRPRWLALMPRLQSAIDAKRSAIYRQYAGDLARALKEIQIKSHAH